jgi:hypothetical protein
MNEISNAILGLTTKPKIKAQKTNLNRHKKTNEPNPKNYTKTKTHTAFKCLSDGGFKGKRKISPKPCTARL